MLEPVGLGKTWNGKGLSFSARKMWNIKGGKKEGPPEPASALLPSKEGVSGRGK